MKRFIGLITVLMSTATAHAAAPPDPPAIAGPALVTEQIEYRHGDTVLDGYLAYAPTPGTSENATGAPEARRPGVLVVHEWYGLGDYAARRARQLAKLGYVAFALDMYGKGVRADNPQDAGKLAGIYKSDRQLMRQRARAGLEVLRSHRLTDPARIAAIGYCFGGMTVLELARSGADLAGVVSFHGNLGTPLPSRPGDIKAKVLVLHGADDPLVSPDEIKSFQEEMRKGRVDWQMSYYGGAVHSYTNPDSGSDPSVGVAYNEAADRRSWEAMKLFFDEIFRAR